MKKILIISLSCILFAGVGLAEKQRVADTRTESEYRAILIQLLEQKDNDSISKIIKEKNFWLLTNRKDLNEFRIEADKALASRGYGDLWKSYILWKNISAIHRKSIGADIAYPKCIACAEKYKCMIDIGAFARRGASIDELIECLDEYIKFPEKCKIDGACFDGAKKGIQEVAAISIKRALRKQGKSFVTKDGINPCEVYMEKLNKALNAPRFIGLNEWLEELGYKSRIDTSKLPSETKIEALKDAIFYGEKTPNNADKTVLSICLGVDGYNEFVKKYNGD